MGKLYGWLGLSTGIITADISDETRRAAYHADITYGTNNEFGFDYLRDNMKFAHDEMVQRPLAYGIVDEVDSILIDEARTPLIISGPAELSEEIYHKADRLIPKLRRDVEYVVEERSRSVTLTERGVHRVEELLGVNNLYDMQHIEMVHHMNQALRAHAVYRRDVDYVVTGGEVVIVDELPGASWTVGAGATVCTRRSRRKRVSVFSVRTTRSRPSPSRTISACMRSFPA